MTDPRRIVLADPLAPRPTLGEGSRKCRFAVAGQTAPGASGDVKMFEWDGEAESMSMVGLQSDAGAGIRALAWSPHPAQRYLLALGLSSGRTHLLSISPKSLSLPLQSAVGTHAALLTVKHSRAITALAFSDRDPLLLATTYERHRSDYSLLIWDVSEAVSTLPKDPDGDQTWVRPPERLESGIMHPPQRSPTQPGHEPHLRHLQQYCASEAVHSVAWVPRSSTDVLASANNKVVRQYDLRAPGRDTGGMSGGAAIHWGTRAVHLLTPDKESPHRLASVESTPAGGIVRLWDTRRPGVELRSVEILEGNGVVAMEWAPGGATPSIAVGTRDGGVNIWDVVAGGTRADGSDEWTTVGNMRHVVKPKQQLQSFAFAPPLSATKREIIFVVKDGSIGAGPLPASPNVALSSRGELAVSLSALTTIDPDAAVQTRVATAEPSTTASPATNGRRESTDERRINRFQLAPERISALLTAEKQLRSGSVSPGRLRSHGHPHSPAIIDDPSEVDEWELADEATTAEGFRRILKHDAAYVMRRRAEEGYGLENLPLNAAVATRFPGAERIAGIWEYIEHFLHATPPEVSQTGEYDLTYAGMWAIWTGMLGVDARADSNAGSAAWANLRSHGVPAHSHEGSGSGASTPRNRPALEHDAEYNAAVQRINAARTETHAIAAPGSHRLPHTERAPQRRMMLAVCGENHAYDTMAEVNRLVKDDQRTKAACWAFFAGEEGPAVTILMRSEEEKHRLMGATIAGFMSQSRAERGSLFWQEHWRSMVDKVDDPYIRAVLARIAGESWDGILYDEGMPLLDRIAIAVCNLRDKDLTAFLRNRLSRTIALGALPGLALTGFTPAGVTLLQRFIDRTGDIQTAALLSAFFPHAYLSKSELAAIKRWQEAYRDLLDSWLAWVPRCAFDVALVDERRRLNEDIRDIVQTVVVCPVCQRQLSRQTEEMLGRKNALKGKMAPPTVRTNICMYCQNALPRCCICLLHVRPADGETTDSMDSAYVACQTCRHGDLSVPNCSHASHILGWFEGGLDGEPAHDACAVAGCDCHCASL